MLQVQIFAIIVILTSSVSRAEYMLSIELNKFNNPNGLLVDGSKCPAPTCLTYFRFCLMLQTNAPARSDSVEGEKAPSCVSQIETGIIGANVIGEDQFLITTNSIRFRFNSTFTSNEQADVDDSLFLLIQALNYDMADSEHVHKPAAKTRLISEWKLPIHFFNFNQWIRYENSVNYKLGQVFLFDYKLQCAEDYYGSKCENRMYFTLINHNTLFNRRYQLKLFCCFSHVLDWLWLVTRWILSSSKWMHVSELLFINCIISNCHLLIGKIYLISGKLKKKNYFIFTEI